MPPFSVFPASPPVVLTAPPAPTVPGTPAGVAPALTPGDIAAGMGLRYTAVELSYADLVNMASLANPYPLMPAVPGAIVFPLRLMARTTRSEATTGTTTNMQCRYAGSTINLLNGSLTLSFGSAGNPFVIFASEVGLDLFGGGVNVDYTGVVCNLVNLSATSGAIPTGRALISCLYFVFPLPPASA